MNLINKELTLAGVILHYWTNSEASKPTIFFLHGAAMDHSMFNDQIETLDEYNVIAWDARGHGASRPTDGSFMVKDLAQDAISVLQNESIESALFIGQSEGSMIAQEVYRVNPQMVKGLVSIGGSPIMIPYSRFDIWLLNISTSIIKLWPYGNFTRALARKTAVTKTAQEYARKTVQALTKQDFLTIWGSATTSLSTSGIENMHLEVPLLLTYGEHDATGTVRKNNIRWKQYESNAELVVIPRAGHNANQDNPVFFNDLLSQFLTTHGHKLLS